MSRTDLISDCFTIIRNASLVRKEDTLMPYSNSMLKIIEILKNEGYIEDFKEVDLGSYKQIKVYLKYINKKSAFRQIKKVSKPGRRVYVRHESVPKVLNGFGFALISTSKGIVTDKQARDLGVGGEYLGMVW
ncbi:MAG: 30S ribosomal protein S8 [Candidatus Omnitrophica bacterium]|nr:30S ribosomal protein S8 [Candidatus Omnitrophota bacterium]